MRAVVFLAPLFLASLFPITNGQTREVPDAALIASEAPPEPVPDHGCSGYESGYLENSDGRNHLTNYSAAQIGDYVDSRVKSGYVVIVYPQVSGKIFVIAACGGRFKIMGAAQQ